jgi:hypothetical protein
MDDNSKRLGSLFWKLNERQVSANVAAKLLQLCAALDVGNWPAAAQIQVGPGEGRGGGRGERPCSRLSVCGGGG